MVSIVKYTNKRTDYIFINIHAPHWMWILIKQFNTCIVGSKVEELINEWS